MAKYEVKHKKLFLAVGGKLEHVAQGSVIELSDKAANALIASGKIKSAVAAKTIAVDGSAEAEAEKLKAEAAAALKSAGKK